MARRRSISDWLDHFEDRLRSHRQLREVDPQANPVKLLAYDISKYVETRELAFRDIEAIVKSISDKTAIERARRLRRRSGLQQLGKFEARLQDIIREKAQEGFTVFKAWVETDYQGIVLTAHPTFSLSSDIRNVLGKIAARKQNAPGALSNELEKLPFLQKAAPTLQEEHTQTQNALEQIQSAIEKINQTIFDISHEYFPDKWTEITPCLVKVYSWVGYDIDGRSDISWVDALRFRLLEKQIQLNTYLQTARDIQTSGQFEEAGNDPIKKLISRLESALESTVHDLELFDKDMSVSQNLVEAANHLTRDSKRRLRNSKPLYRLIDAAIANTTDHKTQMKLLLLRAKTKTFGLGTARVHFRLNSRHVLEGIRSAFGIKKENTDSRTLVLRAAELTDAVNPKAVNFASLALERSTAHRQMILTAQIHKYIDDETPIRLLIAETEDSLVPLGMLYLAKLYGLENHLDISPLFETRNALNNGGRIIGKLLKYPVFRDYVKSRGKMAIQTGFSDAGRFMGQIPATLAIERLQSHFARELSESDLANVKAVVFNTHGESLGRGGHFGSIGERLDYVMSPWAKNQFAQRHIALSHETSFQGGDGFLWFQNPKLAYASLTNILCSRLSSDSDPENDLFYKERDFSWDIYRTISSAQDHLYANPDYVRLLSAFGQNLLVPTGSRARNRGASDSNPDTFTPRQLRAIPHNAILQQFSILANLTYGLGEAKYIDIEKFDSLIASSPRAKLVFGMAEKAKQRTSPDILLAYASLLEPEFWIARSRSEPLRLLAEKCTLIATTLMHDTTHNKIKNLATFLQLDDSQRFSESKSEEDDAFRVILHALRLAVFMKMKITATDLPKYSTQGSTSLDILRLLQDNQFDLISNSLSGVYAGPDADLGWTEHLIEKTEAQTSYGVGFPHIIETVVKPLNRAAQLIKQITIAITHGHDAFG